MPLLLALPLSIGLMLILMVALWPLAFYLRVRRSTAPRQLYRWALRLQLGGCLLSALSMVLIATIAGRWWEGALTYVGAGLGIGLLLGLLARLPARVVSGPGGVFVTPGRAFVFALLAVVLIRLGAGLWQGLQVALGHAAWPESGWMSHAGLLGLAALLIGSALGNVCWMLQVLRRHQRLYGR